MYDRIYDGTEAAFTPNVYLGGLDGSLNTSQWEYSESTRLENNEFSAWTQQIYHDNHTMR